MVVLSVTLCHYDLSMIKKNAVYRYDPSLTTSERT